MPLPCLLSGSRLPTVNSGPNSFLETQPCFGATFCRFSTQKPSPEEREPLRRHPGSPPAVTISPLLFLHPGHGPGLLALAAAPRRAPVPGGRGLGADGGGALQEGLHGPGCARLCSALFGSVRPRSAPLGSVRPGRRRAEPVTSPPPRQPLSAAFPPSRPCLPPTANHRARAAGGP